MVSLGDVVGGIVLCRRGGLFRWHRGNVVKHIFRLMAQLGVKTICNDVSSVLLQCFAVLRSKGCF